MTFPPSNFRRDPAGHVGNQCGHFFLGLFFYVQLGQWGIPLALAIWAAYLFGWEFWWQGGDLFWDSIEDAAFILAGALVVIMLGLGFGREYMAVVAFWLLFGAWLRT